MYAEERQRAILEQARLHGRVDVSSLAASFAITVETVRRDLTALERGGMLCRVHGGAIPIERHGFEPGFADRDTVMTAEKDRIAVAALNHLPATGAVFLDAGTTTGRMAAALPAELGLTVVTHSLTNALTLAGHPNLTLMIVGGRVRQRTLATVDSFALDTLRDTTVEVAFIAADGISPARGLTTPDPAEAMIKRAAIRSARRVILVADHTKVGNDHFARFGDLADVDTLLTDTGIDPRLAREIAAKGPQVVTV
ncbi:DeoR family transcriptional regulator, fructose operon transcriptional repressor [Amycolatopsis xylanica]|uniref:Lactose phosphotransferase system repressor n=1 Tax=Amycolatopsis xylanica TaxID=589385 RepID=A0A1H3GZQ3_9PSEU|nr:DeoR/GlpR family DNA-binding transcription regulator [Amycolatopsis xylanica]SDY07849.1 DeoR family transcriptional regulator, fructose operon transcriptional repressor [Amycolatopsis xylanica]